MISVIIELFVWREYMNGTVFSVFVLSHGMDVFRYLISAPEVNRRSSGLACNGTAYLRFQLVIA